MFGFVSLVEPKTIDEALEDNDWIIAMEEELNQFTRNDVWDLVQKPKGFNIIGTKWVFRNKLVAAGFFTGLSIDYSTRSKIFLTCKSRHRLLFIQKRKG